MPKHAIVIGASSGLGLAIARRLRAAGYRVSGLARRAVPAAAADAAFPCDVSDDASVTAALTAAIGAHGAPDVLCYSAGEGAMGRTTAVPPDAARRAFEVNFWGLDRAVRALLPGMLARGHGTILAVLSLAALRPVPHESYYAASKAAAARYLGCLAHEAAAGGVDIKVLCPGYIPTGFLERAGWHGMERPTVSGSGVSPEDVAQVALDLIARPGGKAATTAVVGWRERAIVLGDRLVPGLYDRLLALRASSRKERA